MLTREAHEVRRSMRCK
jgi:hypothetical protein